MKLEINLVKKSSCKRQSRFRKEIRMQRLVPLIEHSYSVFSYMRVTCKRLESDSCDWKRMELIRQMNRPKQKTFSVHWFSVYSQSLLHVAVLPSP